VSRLSPRLRAVDLWPGELLLLDEPLVVQTVLGSCVSVTFYNRRLGASGICHALLPEAPAGTAGADAFRYVDRSVQELARGMEARGARAPETEVKVFGGGELLFAQPRAGPTVGSRNAETAFAELERLGYGVSASDVRGPRGRKILFNTETGEVYLKRLSKALVGA
jgi:chemotaxis protein CheD